MIEEDYRLMKENPSLVLFIMNEIHRDPAQPQTELSKMKDILHHKFTEEVDREIQAGRMKNIEADHILPFIIGSLQFIFICKNLQMQMYGMSEAAFEDFAEKHKNHIKDMVISFLFGASADQ